MQGQSCSECHADLATAPEGTPCPKCGSRRRDATVWLKSSARAVLMGQPIELNISNTVHALKSDTLTLKPVVATRTFALTISEPTRGEKDPQRTVHTREGDDLIGFAVGPTDDVLVDSISDIKDRLGDDG